MGPKYEFTGETKWGGLTTLHRIRRLSDGKLGGWIEKEDNLSQEGNCWVDDDAIVYEDARVYGNAKVYGEADINCDAQVYGNAQVYGKARVRGKAQVYGNAEVYGLAEVFYEAKVYDNAKVYGRANVGDVEVYGNAKVFDSAWMCGHMKLFDNAQVYGHANVRNRAIVYGNAKVYGRAQVYENAVVYGEAHVYGKAQVYENAKVYGNAQVCGDAKMYGKVEIVKGCISTGEYTGTSIIHVERVESEFIKDFVYKINESSKLDIRTDYDSVDAFFDDDSNDSYIAHEYLIIITIDTKIPILKFEKAQVKNKNIFKFIVDITGEDGDDYCVRSVIDSKEKFNQLLQSTLESLHSYPQFDKYAEELENCL